MKKTLAVVLLLCVAILSFYACGNTTTANVSMYDLSRAMLSATQFGDMTYVSSSDDNAKDLFTYLSDLDYEKVGAFFLAYAKDGKGNADELAVIQVKNKDDLDAAVKSLKAHLEKRVNLYKTYDPTQSEKISRGEVMVQNGLAVLIVSDDNAAVERACAEFLQGN